MSSLEKIILQHFVPPFWASSICCRLASASSSLFFFSSASFAFFSASSFRIFSSSSFFCWASFFSCSALRTTSSVSRKATTTFRSVFAQKCYLLYSVPDLLALGLFVLQPLELLLLLPALLPPFVDVLPQLKIKYVYHKYFSKPTNTIEFC